MTSSEGPQQPHFEQGPADEQAQERPPARPPRQQRPRHTPNPALDPRLARLEQRSRPSRTSEVSLLVIGIVAFFFGVAMHFWVATSVLDSGAESSDESVAEATATPDGPAPTVPPTTGAQPTATPLPDRTDCDEIRGTQYRSVTEREFFLENCTGDQP